MKKVFLECRCVLKIKSVLDVPDNYVNNNDEVVRIIKGEISGGGIRVHGDLIENVQIDLLEVGNVFYNLKTGSQFKLAPDSLGYSEHSIFVKIDKHSNSNDEEFNAVRVKGIENVGKLCYFIPMQPVVKINNS